MTPARHPPALDGVLLVDKPTGMTSSAAVLEVRRIAGAQRAGHAGTLDPLASGLLVVCLDEATKLAAFLHLDDKEYLAVARLGVETTTLDAEGEVVARRDASAVGRVEIERALATLGGQQLQKPPMYSAIRTGGRRLYELARQGLEVERTAREITVHEIALVDLGAPREDASLDVSFRVGCSKGTYVRSLAADLGARLGVGAHLVGLRRTRSGPFTLADACSLEGLPAALAAGRLLSLADASASLDCVHVDAGMARRVRAGQLVPLSDLPPPIRISGRPLRVLDEQGALVAVAEADEARGFLRVVRGFNTVTAGG